MSTFAWTPEDQAAKLESLAGDPEGLRERIESMVQSALGIVEQDARYGAVVLRRIRDRELYSKAGWPTWGAFAEHWCPGAPQRFDTLISALEALEARSDGRDFGEAEARKLATLRKRGRPRKDEEKSDAAPLSRGSNGVAYLAARLRRDDPALAEKVEAGELTVREAARQAGILKPRATSAASLAEAWDRATEEERAAFLAQHGDELRTALEKPTAPPSPRTFVQVPTPEEAEQNRRRQAVGQLTHCLIGLQRSADGPFWLKEVMACEAWKERRSELGHTLPAVTFHALVHEKPPVGLGADYATIEKLIRDDPEAVEMLRKAAGMKASRPRANGMRTAAPEPPVEPISGQPRGQVVALRDWCVQGSRLRATFKSGQEAALRSAECGIHVAPDRIDALIEFLGVYLHTLTLDERPA